MIFHFYILLLYLYVIIKKGKIKRKISKNYIYIYQKISKNNRKLENFWLNFHVK